MRQFFKKIWELIQKSFRSDLRNFLHFFLAFTGIFLILAAIILSTLRVGMYHSTDVNLTSLTEERYQVPLANLGFHEFTPNASRTQRTTPSTTPFLGNGIPTQSTAASQTEPSSSVHLYGNDMMSPDQQAESIFTPGLYVVNYDASGTILNGNQDYIAEMIPSSYTLNKALIGHIDTVNIEDSKSGQTWSFRTTVIVPSATLSTTTGKKVAYIQIFQDVTQIQTSLAATTRTVMWTVVGFWLLSLFVALYLSRWSIRPLQQSLDRQQAFVSNASHELRTPLAILQNRLQLLFQNPDATILDEAENISASMEEVRNMTILTHNLLDMAKSDGHLTVNAETTDMSCFTEIFENYQILAEEKGKAFSSSVKFDKSDEITLDKDLLKQVMTIFFDNAVKYTGDDGAIDISVDKAGPNLTITIADNGPGISDKDKRKIFDRFYRVDEARTRGAGGLGLGLSLAQSIVKAMKGKVSVEDNIPRGTRFIVTMKA
ncbi:MAG: HAMP domain-containing histidine kinase [Streptococcaceae bacterium]|jgi:two-component system sensor histidine kinase CiaH|nr:HAMP domain-containing histidine kinase [Streptococcaceae bacterium]